jgi:hypothetical protein
VTQLKTFVLWLLTGSLAAIAVGWVAAQIHASGHAPVGLVSVGVGAVLGIALRYLANNFGIRCKVRLAIGAAVIAAICVIAEHAWLYRDFRGQWQSARETNAAVAMFRAETPPTAGEYFAREWNAVLWITDAALIVVTTTCVVVLGRRMVGGGVRLADDAKAAELDLNTKP